MAEGASLENWYTGNGIVGSNPTLSANYSFWKFSVTGECSEKPHATRPLLVIAVDFFVSPKT